MGVIIQNDLRRISAKTIQEYIGLSAPWLSAARIVVEGLKILGPDGSHPDPEVIGRLESQEVVKKGDELVKFIKSRLESHLKVI